MPIHDLYLINNQPEITFMLGPKNDPKGIHIAQDDTYSNSTRPIVTHGSQPIT
jgi:hypothetical protein